MTYDHRREKDLKRRRRKEREREERESVPAPAPGAAAAPPMPAITREVVEREFMDPMRLTDHLRRLSELLTLVPDLRGARFAHEAFQERLFTLDRAPIDAAPEEKRSHLLRAALIPPLVDEPLAKGLRASFQRALPQAREQNDRLALVAGMTLLDSWLKVRGPVEQNPIWDAIFGLTLLDHMFEGTVFARLARESVSPDEGNAAKSFAKALAKAEVSKELDRLGLDERDPQALAARYAALVRDKERSYLLGFDALLRFVRANGDFAAQNVQTVLHEGLSPAVRETARELFEGAFAEDITQPLVDDLCSEITRRLEIIEKQLRGEPGAPERPKDAEPPEHEKRTGLVALLALRALPLERNAFLKMNYLGSFDIYRRAAPVEEVPFVQRIWQDPGDRWALEEYEKFLLTRRHTHRAQRVRRYLEEVRAAPKKG